MNGDAWTDSPEGYCSAPIFVRLVEQLADAWPHFRVTTHTTEDGRELTMIEWPDENGEFGLGVPGEFVTFVSGLETRNPRSQHTGVSGGEARD